MWIIINRSTYWIKDLTDLKIHESVLGFCFCSGICAMMSPGCTVSFARGIEQGDLVEFCDEHGYGTGEQYEIANCDRLTMIMEHIKTQFALSKL